MSAQIPTESALFGVCQHAIVLELIRGRVTFAPPFRPLTETDVKGIRMADENEAQPVAVVTREEARTSGLQHFFTGKPCKRQHLAHRLVSNGGCSECNAIHNRNNAEKGRAATAKWREKNVERCRARSLADYYAKQDHYLAAQKRRRAAEPDKCRAQTKVSVAKWRQGNGQKNRDDVKVWREANPEKSREMIRAWRKNNPETARASDANKRAKRQQAEGTYTATDIAAIFKSQGGKCAYCRVSIKKEYHVDHIKALARGGSNWPKNLQLLCQPCNNRKHAKDPINFAQEMGFLL